MKTKGITRHRGSGPKSKTSTLSTTSRSAEREIGAADRKRISTQSAILQNPPDEVPLHLEKDQLWKVTDGFVLIVGMGKSLVHYKFLKMKREQAVPLRMIAREQLESYLKNTHSTLVTEQQEAA